MADRLESFAVNTLIPSVFLNAEQDIAAVMRNATATALTLMGEGLEGRVWQSTSDLTTGTIQTVDVGTIDVVDTGVTPAVLTSGTMSWRDREIVGLFRAMTGATQYPGGANDYQFDAAATPTLFWGYTGKGAVDGVGAQVTPGNPPVPAAGTSWACLISKNLWLYVDPDDGDKLKIYNNTGSTLRTPTLFLLATAQTGARP